MDILERRVSEALRLILEAQTLSEGGTAAGWEIARLYTKAAQLLTVAEGACRERARGNWSHTLERSVEGEVVRVWIGAGRIRSEEGG
jgi:hypothetical protein